MLLVPGLVKAETRIGVRASFNSVVNDISAVNTEDVLKEENYNGYSCGLVLQSHYKSGMGLELGLLYSQEGMTLPNEEDFKHNSLVVPINLKMFIGLSDNLDIFLYGGPQMRLIVGETCRTILDGNFTQDYVLDKATYSLNAGVGVQLSSHLQIFANYNWQLQNLGEYSLSKTENSTVVELGRNPIHTRTLQLGTTIYF